MAYTNGVTGTEGSAMKKLGDVRIGTRLTGVFLVLGVISLSVQKARLRSKG